MIEEIQAFPITDVITYCPDVPLMIAEIAEKHPERLSEEGDYLVPKIPVVWDQLGQSTLCKVRCRTEEELTQLSSLSNLQVLGTIEEVLADPAKKAIYHGVYDPSPVTKSVSTPWVRYVMEEVTIYPSTDPEVPHDPAVMHQEREVLGLDEEGNTIYGTYRTVIRPTTVMRPTDVIEAQGVDVVEYTYTPPKDIGELA